MSKELVVKNYDSSSPTQMVGLAQTLKQHIVAQKLYTNIKGRNYAHVDAWAFAGSLIGVTPKIVKVENLSTDKEYKWKVDVELVNMKGKKVVGFGTALCSSKEAIKKNFDEYAILSMAQTRAIGKAYRNLIGWVMKLSGYESTPSEEMFKMGESVQSAIKNEPAGQNGATGGVSDDDAPVIEAECAECANPITLAEAEYSKKLFKKQLCRSCQELRKKK